jgi:hypothetical protein
MARKIPIVLVFAAALAACAASPHPLAAAALQVAPEPPANLTPPVTDEQILRAAQDIQRAEEAIIRLRQREAELAERLLAAGDQLEKLTLAHAQTAAHTTRLADEERQWALALQSARQRTGAAQWQVQRQRQDLDSLRLQQRLMFAVSWVRLELRPAGVHGQAMWLRNSSPAGSIRVTFREPAFGAGVMPQPKVRVLAAGEEINLGTRRAGDRVAHEAAVLGAEWERGGPPPGTRYISSSEIRDAELRLLDLEREAAAAMAAERQAADGSGRALQALRTARAAEAPHERALANHRRAMERLARDQQFTAAQLREAGQKLGTARAYHERLLRRKQEQEWR